MGLSNLRAFPDGLRVLRTIIKEWKNNPRLRMVRNHESSVDSESFEKSFHGLLEDTNQFVKMAKQLAKDKLKTVAEKLLSRYDTLMSTDMGEASRNLQKRYATYYRAVYNNYLMKHIPDTDNVEVGSPSASSKTKAVAGEPKPTSS
jgi:hypothetical protein